MLRSEDLGSAGAFIDTTGAKRRKKQEYYVRTDITTEEEEQLEALVFGRQPFKPRDAGRRLSETDSEEEEEQEESSSGSEGEEEGEGEGRAVASSSLKKQPAWKDEDDEEISVDMTAKAHRKRIRQEKTDSIVPGATYSKRLRNHFERLSGQPEWAKRGPERRRRRSDSSSDSDSEEEGLLQRTGPLLSHVSPHLPPTTLDIKRMRDANSKKRAHAVVRSLEFHPTANVILTAGWHKTLDLFQVDGEVNPKLQSIHVQRFPISTAHFTRDGTEVVMAGQQKSFFVYDMIAGKITRIRGIRGRGERYLDKFVVTPDNKLLAFLGEDGYIPLVSNKTKQWVADLKMNGTVRDVTFTPDSKHLLSIGGDGKVYVWDLSSRECVHCFTDEGCVVGNKVGVSPDGRYIACGSDSGVVNVYDNGCLRNETPKPLKAIMNLTTSIDHLQFNPTSELLAVGSQAKKDALKLVHLSSLTVFSNWPNLRSHLSYVSALDLSPLSQYLAVGNDKGKALLYRLNHYHQLLQD